MKRPVIFWDVDTQHDFMDADGKVYVPDAEQIKPNLRRLTAYAHERQVHIVASAEECVPGDRARSAAPDVVATFPEHCLRGTRGAEKIEETQLFSPLVIDPAPIPHEQLARTLWGHGGDVLLRTHRFDVFTNPNTETLLDVWDPTEIVVYGVALDVCGKHAIEGFLERGVPAIHLVLDATKAIHPEAVEALVAEWTRQEVNVVSTDDVLRGRVV